MKPLTKSLIGWLLTLAAVIRLLADKDYSTADQEINIACVIGIVVGVMMLTMGLYEGDKK